jgi:hypothetical protein
MIQAKHCDLCEHPKRDLKKGLTCGLNDKKPDFKKVCPNILFNEKFQTKLESTCLEFERNQKAKNEVYLTFFILSIFGFLLIVGNKILAELSYNTTYFWVYRIGSIGIGIIILIRAYFQLNRFRTKLKSANFEKNKIDSVLKEYRISYKVNIKYKEKIHGNQNIEINTEYKNWTKKRTTTKYIKNRASLSKV